MKNFNNYDFTAKRVKFFNVLLGRFQSLTKFDIAYHLNEIDHSLPWTVMYDVFSYAELKDKLYTKLIAI